MGLMFGKGIYLTDCFSRAATMAMNEKKPQRVTVLVAETALGDIYTAKAPQDFESAPIYHHSVFGPGKMKPADKGIKDLK